MPDIDGEDRPRVPAALRVDVPAEDLAVAAARAADDKSGRDIVVLAVGDVLAITECFVIAHGGSDRQVKAIVDDVEAQLGLSYGVKPRRVEGLDTQIGRAHV